MIELTSTTLDMHEAQFLYNNICISSISRFCLRKKQSKLYRKQQSNRLIIILVIVVFVGLFISAIQATDQESVSDVELESHSIKLLSSILPANYSKALRPNFGGKPVQINVSIYINDISAISEAGMEFKVDFYMRHMWRDPRLRYPVRYNISRVSFGEEFTKKIWLPDSSFNNAKDMSIHKIISTESTTQCHVKSDGEIFHSTRVSLLAQCPMDLTFFPLDQQKCSIEICSYGLTDRDVLYYWAEGIAVQISPTIYLPTFQLLGYSKSRHIDLYVAGNFTRLTVDFFLARSIGYYVSQIFIPALLVVIISWVPFWLDRNDHHARVALGVTTVLTITTLITNANSDFPKISHIKAIDVYLFTCFNMVFLSLIEYATVGYYEEKRRSKAKNENLSSSPHALDADIPSTSDSVPNFDSDHHRNHYQQRSGKDNQAFVPSSPHSIDADFSYDINRNNNAPNQMETDFARTIESKQVGNENDHPHYHQHHYRYVKSPIRRTDSRSKCAKTEQHTHRKRHSLNLYTQIFLADSSRIDKFSRWLFPIVFFTFNLIYAIGMYVLVRTYSFNDEIQVKL